VQYESRLNECRFANFPDNPQLLVPGICRICHATAREYNSYKLLPDSLRRFSLKLTSKSERWVVPKNMNWFIWLLKFIVTTTDSSMPITPTIRLKVDWTMHFMSESSSSIEMTGWFSANAGRFLKASIAVFAALLVLSNADSSLASAAITLQNVAADKSVPSPDSAPSEFRKEILVQIPLPIDNRVSENVKQLISAHLDTVPLSADPKDRPVLVLEFDTSNSRTGRGSQFEDCLKLARFLTSAKMNRMETVAYVPAPRGVMLDSDVDSELTSQLVGHGVLVALACNHLVMHLDSSIGKAGIDEEFVDEGVVNYYKSIAAQKLTLPVELATALIDPQATLYQVQTDDNKTVYVDRNESNRLNAMGKVVKTETLSESGTLAEFTSQQLMSYQLIRLRPSTRRDIERKFSLEPNSLAGDPTLGKEWSGLQVRLDNQIDRKNVSWIINALEQRWTIC